MISGPPADDPLVRLMRTRYNLLHAPEAMVGCDHDQALDIIGRGRQEQLLTTLLERYKALEADSDFVLCLGSDYSGPAAALELDFNATLARNLGCPLLPVMHGAVTRMDVLADSVRSLLESLTDRGSELAGAVVNRVPRELIQQLRDELGDMRAYPPVYVMPELSILAMPTVGEIACALGATLLRGGPEHMSRAVSGYKVAAMELPHFLEHLQEGSLVITPGDRSDIILGSFLADVAVTYPQVSALLLTGGLRPAPQVQRVLDGLQGSPVPVLGVDADTYGTAMNVASLDGHLVPEDERKIAAALGVAEFYLDGEDLLRRIAVTAEERMTPLMFEYQLVQWARRSRKHIVLPEGTDERILRAAEILRLRDVVSLTLLGEPEEVRRRIAALGLRLDGVPIIDPTTSERRKDYAHTYYELRRLKGISKEMAFDTLADVSYFGTLMVHHGDADGMVSGALHTTQHTIRPAFEVIKTCSGCAIVSSVFFMCLEDRVLVYGDCAVNPNPDARQLADIAISSAETARAFGIAPRIALLSYSTGESGKGRDVDKVREATRLVRERRSDLKVAGPIQYDAAVDAAVASSKMPDSEVAGRATVFVFPDLNTGNNTYKAVQRSAGAVAVGPILQGLNKPVNDLSRGCTVADVVNTVAITAIQAQMVSKP